MADIVDKLLSEEELAEIAEFPTLPGMYYDRESQKMVMASALRDNWFVDTRMTLLQIEHRTNVKRDQELAEAERKGQVTERVIDAVKQKSGVREGAMGLRSSADAKPTEGSGQEPADPAMDPAVYSSEDARGAMKTAGVRGLALFVCVVLPIDTHIRLLLLAAAF